MFTIEHDHDATIITTLDDNGAHEDIQVLLDEETVCIRQFDDEQNTHDLVIMSLKQFDEILMALGLPEGCYVQGKRNENS